MLALTAAVITGVICIVVARRAMEIHLIGADGYVMDYHICQFMNVIAMIASVFTVYFGGIPFSSGTLRNMVLAGHNRFHIFFSIFVTNVIAGCAILLLHMLTVFVAGYSSMGAFQVYHGIATALFLLCAVALIISLCAFTSLITVLFSGQIGAFVVSVGGLLASLCYGVHQLNLLTDLTIWEGSFYQKGRALFLMNLLPGSQMMRLFILPRIPSGLDDITAFHPFVILCGSLAIILLTFVIGGLLFQRKDLR